MGSFADPNFPAANVLGVGRGDASMARSGDRALPAGSSSYPLTRSRPSAIQPVAVHETVFSCLLVIEQWKPDLRSAVQEFGCWPEARYQQVIAGAGACDVK